MEEKKNIIKKYGDILFVVLLIIGLLILNYSKNHPKKQAVDGETPNVIVEPSHEEDEYTPSVKEQKDTFHSGINSNIDQNLYLLGFVNDTSDKCLSTNKCFKKDVYYASYSTNSSWFDLQVDGTKDNIKNYDTKKDFELLEKIYGTKFDLSNSTKKLINSFSRDGFFSFNVEIEDIYLGVSYYSSGLKYRVSPRSNNTQKAAFFKPIELNTMIYPIKEKERPNFKRKLYDISMEYNSTYFKYKDFIYAPLEKAGNNLCSVSYNEGKYEFSSSFCHGGTSDTYYKFDIKSGVRDYNLIKLSYRSNYFSDYYLDAIKSDVKYFANKLDTKLELSKDDISNLKNFMNKQEPNITININSKLEINIEYKDYSTVRYYYVEYKIYK